MTLPCLEVIKPEREWQVFKVENQNWSSVLEDIFSLHGQTTFPCLHVFHLSSFSVLIPTDQKRGGGGVGCWPEFMLVFYMIHVFSCFYMGIVTATFKMIFIVHKKKK